MKVPARNIILIGLGAALAGGLIYTAFRTKPVPVDLHIVTSGPMQVTVNADGKTRIRDIYEVAAPLTGTALRSPVEVGERVVRGETVVAIVEPTAPSLLDSRSRMQAEAAVREAQAARAQAESGLRKADEDLTELCRNAVRAGADAGRTRRGHLYPARGRDPAACHRAGGPRCRRLGAGHGGWRAGTRPRRADRARGGRTGRTGG
ncbi:hypothetical protein [Rhodovulum sp.]|uniref:hypothetical protein n=1 Tax=Rhodovulum sp. TaxID=34009 RepID=UPI0017D105BB|nr:hypothetical protein [Rhodovulum sp.]HDR27364.1 hypothetical protein [Rhodovulum sp.]